MAILIFKILSIDNAIAIIKTPPVAVISVITAGIKSGCNTPANKVILPCYTKIDRADKLTPIPNVAAKTMAEIPSSSAFAYKIPASPLMPS